MTIWKEMQKIIEIEKWANSTNPLWTWKASVNADGFIEVHWGYLTYLGEPPFIINYLEDIDYYVAYNKFDEMIAYGNTFENCFRNLVKVANDTY